jgi:hypothetical protein
MAAALSSSPSSTLFRWQDSKEDIEEGEVDDGEVGHVGFSSRPQQYERSNEDRSSSSYGGRKRPLPGRDQDLSKSELCSPQQIPATNHQHPRDSAAPSHSPPLKDRHHQNPHQSDRDAREQGRGLQNQRSGRGDSGGRGDSQLRKPLHSHSEEIKPQQGLARERKSPLSNSARELQQHSKEPTPEGKPDRTMCLNNSAPRDRDSDRRLQQPLSASRKSNHHTNSIESRGSGSNKIKSPSGGITPQRRSSLDSNRSQPQRRTSFDSKNPPQHRTALESGPQSRPVELRISRPDASPVGQRRPFQHSTSKESNGNLHQRRPFHHSDSRKPFEADLSSRHRSELQSQSSDQKRPSPNQGASKGASNPQRNHWRSDSVESSGRYHPQRQQPDSRMSQESNGGGHQPRLFHHSDSISSNGNEYQRRSFHNSVSMGSNNGGGHRRRPFHNSETLGSNGSYHQHVNPGSQQRLADSPGERHLRHSDSRTSRDSREERQPHARQNSGPPQESQTADGFQARQLNHSSSALPSSSSHGNEHLQQPQQQLLLPRQFDSGGYHGTNHRERNFSEARAESNSSSYHMKASPRSESSNRDRPRHAFPHDESRPHHRPDSLDSSPTYLRQPRTRMDSGGSTVIETNALSPQKQQPRRGSWEQERLTNMASGYMERPCKSSRNMESADYEQPRTTSPPPKKGSFDNDKERDLIRDRNPPMGPPRASDPSLTGRWRPPANIPEERLPQFAQKKRRESARSDSTSHQDKVAESRQFSNVSQSITSGSNQMPQKAVKDSKIEKRGDVREDSLAVTKKASPTGVASMQPGSRTDVSSTMSETRSKAPPASSSAIAAKKPEKTALGIPLKWIKPKVKKPVNMVEKPPVAALKTVETNASSSLKRSDTPIKSKWEKWVNVQKVKKETSEETKRRPSSSPINRTVTDSEGGSTVSNNRELMTMLQEKKHESSIPAAIVTKVSRSRTRDLSEAASRADMEGRTPGLTAGDSLSASTFERDPATNVPKVIVQNQADADEKEDYFMSLDSPYVNDPGDATPLKRTNGKRDDASEEGKPSHADARQADSDSGSSSNSDDSSDDSDTDEEEIMNWASKMFGISQPPSIARPKQSLRDKSFEKTATKGSTMHVHLSSPITMKSSDPVTAVAEIRRTTKKRKLAEQNVETESEEWPEVEMKRKKKMKITPELKHEVPTEEELEKARLVREEDKRKREAAKRLTAVQIRAILGEEDNSVGACHNWVRRSSRHPMHSILNSKQMKGFVDKLKSNDLDMRVLKMKKYINDPNAPQCVLDVALDALEDNANCEALYIQNFNYGMRENQVLHLLKILQQPACKIWCLNIGETYNVTTETWDAFTKGLKKTKVTHMYASEHTITTAMKDDIRETIRMNRSKHDMHINPNNLDVIIQCTHCWWNPVNAKCLRPYLRNRGFEEILNDRDLQGLQGSSSDAPAK